MAKGIAIKIDEGLLRDIHVHAAEKGMSTQQYVTELIERDLFPERFPELTEDQTQGCGGGHEPGSGGGSGCPAGRLGANTGRYGHVSVTCISRISSITIRSPLARIRAPSRSSIFFNWPVAVT